MPTALYKKLDVSRNYRCCKCDEMQPQATTMYMVRSRSTGGWCAACVREYCKIEPANVPWSPSFTPWNDG
jgi:hypothetical protein